MKNIIAAGLLPLAALLAFSAPALAAPNQSDSSQPGNAEATINQLKAQGIIVRVSRIGNAPLDECQVTNISKLSTPRQIIPIFDEDDINVFTQLPQQKATVTLNCAG